MEMRKGLGETRLLGLIPIYVVLVTVLTTTSCTANAIDREADLPIPTIHIRPSETISQNNLSTSCVPSLIQLTNEHIIDFIWRPEDNNLYFLTAGQSLWRFYDLSSHTIYSSTTFIPSFERNWDQIADTFSVKDDWFDISLSPNGDRLIYTQKVISAENGDRSAQPELVQDVFFVIYGSQPVYIGRIDGQIDDIMWFPDETKVLLYMRYASPYQISEAYVWILDLDKQSVRPMFVRKFPDRIPIVRDITPDGKWIFFIYLDPGGARNLRMKNIKTEKEETLELPASTLFWWLPSKHEFLGISKLDNDVTESIFIFSMDTREIKRIKSGEINVRRGSERKALPSSDFSYLAFRQADTGYLYLQTLCLK